MLISMKTTRCSPSAAGTTAVLVFFCGIVFSTLPKTVHAGGEVKLATSSPGLFLGLSPVVTQDLAVTDHITLGGEYDYDAAKFAPSRLLVSFKDKAWGVPTSAKMTWATPLDRASVPVVEVALGDLDRAKIVLDSSKLKETKNPIKVIETKITRIKRLTIEPKWRPRQFTSAKSKGLEVDVKGELSERATILATLAPYTRPKLKFAFNVAKDFKLRLQPLLGDDGTKTKLELETTRLPKNVKLTAGLLERTVSLAATVPELLGGTLKPELSLNLDSPKKGIAFKLSQSFDI